MSRRRRSQGVNVSFFAFQDIITSVTGILILIVILLVLMIQSPGVLDIPVERPNNLTLAELEALIAEAKQKYIDFEELKQKTAGATDSQLKAEIQGIKDSLNADVDPRGKGLQAELEAAEKEVVEVEKEATKLEDEKEEIAGTVAEIKGEVDSKADGLAKALESSDIWLKIGDSDKTPLPIVVDGAGIDVLDFADPEKKTRHTAGSMITEFSKIMDQSDSATSYFVFFVKPSGIANLQQFRAIVQQSDFSLGYSPINEEVDVKLLVEN